MVDMRNFFFFVFVEQTLQEKNFENKSELRKNMKIFFLKRSLKIKNHENIYSFFILQHLLAILDAKLNSSPKQANPSAVSRRRWCVPADSSLALLPSPGRQSSSANHEAVLCCACTTRNWRRGNTLNKRRKQTARRLTSSGSGSTKIQRPEASSREGSTRRRRWAFRSTKAQRS